MSLTPQQESKIPRLLAAFLQEQPQVLQEKLKRTIAKLRPEVKEGLYELLAEDRLLRVKTATNELLAERDELEHEIEHELDNDAPKAKKK